MRKCPAARCTRRKNRTHFLNEYPNLEIEISEFNPKQNENIITHLFTAWEDLKHKSHDHDAHEWEALKHLCRLADKLSYQIIILKNDITSLGFCIFELSEQKYIIGHFMKVLPQTPDREAVIFNNIARAFLHQGFRYFNTEDDFGIAPLRDHKMHCTLSFL